MRVDVDAARAQQHRLVAGERDDRAFDADVAGAAVEDHRDAIAEIVGDVLRGRRRHVAEAIRRRRRDAVPAASANAREQRARDRMRRHAQADAVLAAGDDVVDVRGARQDQRQRPGPERARERARAGSGTSRAHASTSAASAQVDDQRMIGRAALGREDPRARRPRFAGVGAEPVDGLGRKRDELALAQAASRVGDAIARRERRSAAVIAVVRSAAGPGAGIC